MVINPTYISVPDFGASADIVEPDSPAPYVDGYLPNQQWPAQHANFFLNGLTTNLNDAVDTVSATVVEINNVLSAAGITPSSSVTNQLLQSIQQSSGGLLWREDCRVATTANITLSGAQTIDGISVVAGDRVLVKNQSTGADNGVYLCAAGAWTRAVDLDASAEMVNGVAVRVLVGTANASTAWVLNTGGTITLGSTSLVFVKAPLPGFNMVTPTALPYTSAALSRNTTFIINNLTGNLDITAGASAQGTIVNVLVYGLSASSSGVTFKIGTDVSLYNGYYTVVYDGSAWQIQKTIGNQKITTLLQNVGLATSVGSSALTIALKQEDGSTDPSAGAGAVLMAFRSSTLSSGAQVLRTVNAALSIVISSGSTLGFFAAMAEALYIYAIDNAGTVELAVSGSNTWSEADLQTTTAEGGGGAADSKTALYSTTARSNVAIRYIGYALLTEATPGTWATNATLISVGRLNRTAYENGVIADTGNGHGSTDTAIRRITNTTNIGSGTAVTHVTNATNGSTFTINEDGMYAIDYYDSRSSNTANFGFSINSNQLTTSITAITAATRLCLVTVPGANTAGSTVSMTLRLRVGDILRPHDNTACDATTTLVLRIRKIGA